MTKTLTAKICKISGKGTYTARSQLKSEGFKFDGETKSWSREVNVCEAGDIHYGEHVQGSVESYQHHWACYAKQQPIVIELA